jgi:hypothetical protein
LVFKAGCQDSSRVAQNSSRVQHPALVMWGVPWLNKNMSKWLLSKRHAFALFNIIALNALYNSKVTYNVIFVRPMYGYFSQFTLFLSIIALWFID